ncbi:MAG: permease [Tissierellaceae bacterium]|nr:permease [Tissierellaceae bacterium]
MKMTQSTIILSIVAIILIFINSKKTGKQVEGLKSGMKQMLNTLPLILGAFILAGMIEVLIPAEFVQRWLSKEAGFKGIILGTFGGMILAMGPYASFPIIASIMASGAGLGTIVSIITGWTLLGLSKAPFETAFFGVKFFAYKLVFSIPFCFIAGLLAHVIEMVI